MMDDIYCCFLDNGVSNGVAVDVDEEKFEGLAGRVPAETMFLGASLVWKQQAKGRFSMQSESQAAEVDAGCWLS